MTAAVPAPALLLALGAAGWPAPEQEDSGGWSLRAAAGVTQRANSALALRDDPDPAVVQAFYAARGLVPRVQTGDGPVADRLAARGWRRASPTDVLVGPLPVGDPADAVVADAPSDAWLRTARDLDPARLAVLRRIVTGVPAGYAELRRGGEPVAVGRGVVQGEWLYLAALAVRVEHRRQGLARVVMAALARWAAQQGAERVHLQVEQGNAPARQLYADLEVAGSYAYWSRD